jgi:hypothetical protein
MTPDTIVCVTQVLCGLGVLLVLAWLHERRW